MPQKESITFSQILLRHKYLKIFITSTSLDKFHNLRSKMGLFCLLFYRAPRAVFCGVLELSFGLTRKIRLLIGH